MAAYCGNCGGKVAQDINFCTICGERIKTKQTEGLSLESYLKSKGSERAGFFKKRKINDEEESKTSTTSNDDDNTKKDKKENP